MQGTAMLAYRWLSTLLSLPLLLSAFVNYYNRFGAREEQRLVYVMDQLLMELTGIASFSLAETVLCLLAGLACLAVWVPFGKLPNLFGLLMGASYLALLAQYAHYGGLPDQFAGFVVIGLVYVAASVWGVVGQDVFGSGARGPFQIGAGLIGLGLLGLSVRMSLRAPHMEQTFSRYRPYMQLTGLESPAELGNVEPQ